MEATATTAVMALSNSDPSTAATSPEPDPPGTVLETRPPMSASPPRIIIIGAGSRGIAYARAIDIASNGIVTAVAEPNAYKRANLGKLHIWGDNPVPEGAAFESWTDFITYERDRRAAAAAGQPVSEGIDAAFVCVLDEMHRDVIIALAELGGLHIMCEKPLATTLDDCVAMYRALHTPANAGCVFSIGHVLRYSPHNVLLRRLLLEERVVGDVLSVHHTEPIGWWHFTHSYVRGNWRREDTTAPSLLTKSCHDIDILLWLLCTPTSYTDASARPHLPSTVSSTGALQYFRKNRKPLKAGNATNCLSCPVEPDCKYSAKRVYVDEQLQGLKSGNTYWPINVVVPDIEDLVQQSPAHAEQKLMETLAEDYGPDATDEEIASRNWFGRCVYESDNDVCDEQVVTVTWEDDPDPVPASSEATSPSKPTADSLGHRGAKTATFHMVAHTTKICERYTHLYGVDGQVWADSRTIVVEDFRTGETTTHRPPLEDKGHGGGDKGLTRQFVLAVDNVKNHGWAADRAQREIVGCTLEEVVRSHALVFCAEEARMGKKVVDWATWWDSEVKGKLK